MIYLNVVRFQQGGSRYTVDDAFNAFDCGELGGYAHGHHSHVIDWRSLCHGLRALEVIGPNSTPPQLSDAEHDLLELVGWIGTRSA
jgi:hypothetical protein